MCGIYLYYSNNNELSLDTIISNLKLIQHRGQDSYGILYLNNNDFKIIKKKGILQTIDTISSISSIKSNLFLSHLRYKTSGTTNITEAQPIVSYNKFGIFSFVFNGNLPLEEYADLYDKKFTLDTDLIEYYLINMANDVDNWDELLKKFINTFKRAYSIILITLNDIYVFKDIYDIRPLSISLSKTTLEICSESIGIRNNINNSSLNNNIKSNNITIKGGELLKFNLNNNKIKLQKSYNYFSNKKIISKTGGKCLFEYVYFLSPDSTWGDIKTSNIREKWGIELAKKDIEDNCFDNKDEYIVIGIPNSGIAPAIAYAKTIGINYRQAITKNTKVNRTFILEKSKRDIVSKMKYIYNEEMIYNKKVIIVDDSIVRGITIKNLVSSLKINGAKEIHIRVNSPPVTNICKYGIDIPTTNELVANNNTIEEMNTIFKSTSLKYLDLEKMMISLKNTNYCTGCFNSDYGNIVSRDKTRGEKILSLCNLDW